MVNRFKQPFRSIKELAMQTKNRFKKGVVVLAYHRVALLPDYPYPIVVEPDNFAQQMETLHKQFHPLSLTELADSIELQDIPKRGVVVTFDDGYIDNLTQALPILDAYQIPATVFVTTGNVYEQIEFWWDELEHLVLKPMDFPNDLKISFNGKFYHWSTKTFLERNTARRAIRLILRPMKYADRQDILEQVAAQVRQSRVTRPDHRPMTNIELQQFASNELIQIGAHTVTHPILSSLPYDEQYHELKHSRDELEAATGQVVDVCSYPYGSAEDFNEDSIKAARDCGFRIACTTLVGVVRKDIDPFMLPRCWIDNWDRESFEQRLNNYFNL
jgi:peptidoglycan/xylan/chitin deacetylase (PgdA/CDA1 family)